MTTQQYIDRINSKYKLGNYTEHTFRGDLEQLVETLLDGVQEIDKIEDINEKE